MSDFGEGRWMVGRKTHRCEYCYGQITQGEEHYHYRGMFDGQWQNWRMHRECREDFDMNCEGEFTPGEAPMPERVQSAQIISRHMCPCELAQQLDPECPLHGREVLVVSHRASRTE